MFAMKSSRLFYCAVFTVTTGLLISHGASPWVTVPLGAFAAWWSYVCTHALWSEFSYRIAVWRLHQALSLDGWPEARKVKRWEWLSTLVAVLCFPILLWLPLIFLAFK